MQVVVKQSEKSKLYGAQEPSTLPALCGDNQLLAMIKRLAIAALFHN